MPFLIDAKCPECGYLAELWSSDIAKCPNCHIPLIKVISAPRLISVSPNAGEVKTASFSYVNDKGRTVHKSLPEITHV